MDTQQAGVILACLKVFGNLTSLTQKLNKLQMLAVKIFAFCSSAFTGGKSLIWIALCLLSFFISLNASSTPTHEI